MKKKEEKRSNLRRFLYPAIVVTLVAVCAYLLVPGFRELEDVRARIAKLERTRREKESLNEALRAEIASMYTSEGIERAARRHLRLAKPDEVIVLFRSAEEEKSRER